jgi:hypothetical protein
LQEKQRLYAGKTEAVYRKNRGCMQERLTEAVSRTNRGCMQERLTEAVCRV